MSGTTAALGSALRVAATAAAAGSLRRATDEAKKQFFLMMALGMTAAAGIVCLSAAAFIVLRDQLGTAEAWLLVGVIYLLTAGAVYFISQERPRR